MGSNTGVNMAYLNKSKGGGGSIDVLHIEKAWLVHFNEQSYKCYDVSDSVAYNPESNTFGLVLTQPYNAQYLLLTNDTEEPIIGKDLGEISENIVFMSYQNAIAYIKCEFRSNIGFFYTY